MALAYLLRDGNGEQRLVSRLTVPASLFRNRRLSKPCADLPCYNLHGIVGPANPMAGPNRVALRIDDADEAAQIGATAGAYHLVLDFAPADLLTRRSSRI
jgi:hypothetical protein